MMKRTTLLAILIMCAAANCAMARERWFPYHFPEGATLQDAINDCNDGDIIRVLYGIYSGPGNRDLDFGGLAITFVAPFGPGETTIDCGESGRGFYFHSGEDANSVVEGFTIRNGRASEKGGAIYCESSSPTITNCIITENSAEGLLDTDTYGGGIYCKDSSPTITDCTISYNTAAFGGGIYCALGSSLTISNCVIKGNERVNDNESGYFGGGGIYCRDSSLTISNCTISDNKAKSDGGEIGCGGGISCEPGSSAVISDCTIAGNSANHGGGISGYASSLEVIDCTISNNSAWGVGMDISGNGGGVHLEAMGSAEFSGCTISGNSAWDFGGGFQLIDCSATISDCTISGNLTDYFDGGAIACLGSSPDIINCTISSNESTYGVGGINCEKYTGAASTPTITNCIFEDNTWYAIYEFDEYSDAILSYCLFNDNPDGDYYDDDSEPGSKTKTGADEINSLAEAHDNIDGEPSFIMDGNDVISGQWTANPSYDSATMRTTLTDSSASFIEDEFVGRYINADITQRAQLLITANTSTTIQVVDGDDDVWKYVVQGDSYMIIDYHLQDVSVCINAGDPGFVPEPGQKDIDGHPRVVNGRVDIGSDELFNEAADFNGDGAINFLDHAILANAWGKSEGQTGWNPLCDLNGDGTINYEDLDLFVYGWPSASG